MVKAMDLLACDLVFEERWACVSAIGDLEPVYSQHTARGVRFATHQLSVSETGTPWSVVSFVDFVTSTVLCARSDCFAFAVMLVIACLMADDIGR